MLRKKHNVSPWISQRSLLFDDVSKTNKPGGTDARANRLYHKGMVSIKMAWDEEVKSSQVLGVVPGDRELKDRDYYYQDFKRMPRSEEPDLDCFIFPRPTEIVTKCFLLLSDNPRVKGGNDKERVIFFTDHLNELMEAENIQSFFHLPIWIEKKVLFLKYFLLAGGDIKFDDVFKRHTYYAGYTDDMRELLFSMYRNLSNPVSASDEELVKIIELGFERKQCYRFGNVSRLASLIRPLLSLMPKHRDILRNFLSDYDYRHNRDFSESLASEFKYALKKGKVNVYEFLYFTIHREYFDKPAFTIDQILEWVNAYRDNKKDSLARIFKHILNPFNANPSVKVILMRNDNFMTNKVKLLELLLEVAFQSGCIFSESQLKSVTYVCKYFQYESNLYLKLARLAEPNQFSIININEELLKHQNPSKKLMTMLCEIYTDIVINNAVYTVKALENKILNCYDLHSDANDITQIKNLIARIRGVHVDEINLSDLKANRTPTVTFSPGKPSLFQQNSSLSKTNHSDEEATEINTNAERASGISNRM